MGGRSLFSRGIGSIRFWRPSVARDERGPVAGGLTHRTGGAILARFWWLKIISRIFLELSHALDSGRHNSDS